MSSIKLSQVTAKTHRLINSRFPTVGVFDDLEGLEPDDIRFAFELEMATNDRYVLPMQRLNFLPEDQYVTGESGSIIMAVFLHADVSGGRFSDRRLGAGYASLDLETAVAEVQYPNLRRLKASAGGFPCSIQVRELVSSINCDLIELRGQGGVLPSLYHEDDNSESQKFAASHRWPAKVDHALKGIIFVSVRHREGSNVCLWRPKDVGQPVIQGRHLQFEFTSPGKVGVLELSFFAG